MTISCKVFHREKPRKSTEFTAIPRLMTGQAALLRATDGSDLLQKCSAARLNRDVLPARILACSDKVRGNKRAKKNAAVARLAA